jgi:hypothetical protein
MTELIVVTKELTVTKANFEFFKEIENEGSVPKSI